MRASLRRAGPSLLGALALLLGSTAASADELLVMPYACSVVGGRPVLTPAPEQSHRIIGAREQRPYTTCSPANPEMCRNWVLHRFDLDCRGARVPWVAVVASFEAETSRRAWVEDGRLVLRMPRSWSLERDDPCARPLSATDRLDFGRMRRYCADKRAMAPPPIVEMPLGFAPMLGIDGIFVRATGPSAGRPPDGPVASGPAGRSEFGGRVDPVAPPRPMIAERETAESRSFSEPRSSPEPRTFPEPRPSAEPQDHVERAPPQRGMPPPPARTERSSERAAAPAPPTVTPPKAAVAPPPPPKTAPQPSTPAAAESPPVPAAPSQQAAAPAPAPDQPIIPKIINRPQAPVQQQVAAQPKETAAEPPMPKANAGHMPAQPAETAAVATEPEPISVNLLSAIQTPTVGIIGFGALAFVLLVAFGISRRRERLAGVPPMRDIASVSLGGHGSHRPTEPRLPALRRPSAAEPSSLSPRPSSGPPAPPGAWVNRIPQTRTEAMQVLGMGVSPDAGELAIKKVVDGLRMSWHPDFAKDDADRQLREFRLKQINAAWELMCGKSVARLDS